MTCRPSRPPPSAPVCLAAEARQANTSAALLIMQTHDKQFPVCTSSRCGRTPPHNLFFFLNMPLIFSSIGFIRYYVHRLFEVVNLVKSFDWFWLVSRDYILIYNLKPVPNSGQHLAQTAVNILTVYLAVYPMRHLHWLSESSGSNSAGVQAQVSFHLKMPPGSVSSHLETCHFQDISI